MAVTYTNGFTTTGSGQIFSNFFNNAAPNYTPYGSRDLNDWGYGLTDTTSLPTPQTYTFTEENGLVTISGDSNPFDILLNGATAIQITGVQFVNSSNAPLLEVNVNDSADFIYDGEFTIVGSSTIDFSTSVDFYAK